MLSAGRVVLLVSLLVSAGKQRRLTKLLGFFTVTPWNSLRGFCLHVLVVSTDHCQ